MENGMNVLEAVLNSLNGQCIKDAQRCSENVTKQYSGLGREPQLNMIAYDDLA